MNFKASARKPALGALVVNVLALGISLLSASAFAADHLSGQVVVAGAPYRQLYRPGSRMP